MNGSSLIKNILIIGASGYIGSRLSYLLAKSGYAVTALCYPGIPDSSEWKSLMANVIVGDITSFDTVNELTNDEYDLAIHLVSLDHTDSNKEPNLVNTINVMPIWNLLELFKEKNTLKQMIYFSTVHVYGSLPSGEFDEQQKVKPNTPYGLTHFLSENICNMYNLNSDMKCVNLRLSNSYGSPILSESNCWSLVINDLCRSAFRDGRIIIKSDGTALRDFIHYRDIFGAIQQLIKSDMDANDTTYHLSSGNTYSILELASFVKKVYSERYGRKAEIIIKKSKRSILHESNNRYLVSNKKITALGFKPKVSIKSGINELFEYLEMNA
jgi:UDP-glucose 4-epimerase